MQKVKGTFQNQMEGIPYTYRKEIFHQKKVLLSRIQPNTILICLLLSYMGTSHSKHHDSTKESIQMEKLSNSRKVLSYVFCVNVSNIGPHHLFLVVTLAFQAKIP